MPAPAPEIQLKFQQQLRFLAPALRELLPEIVPVIARHVQDRVDAFAPTASSHRRHMIEAMVARFAEQFCAVIEGQPIEQRLLAQVSHLAACAAQRGDSERALLAAWSHLGDHTLRYLHDSRHASVIPDDLLGHLDEAIDWMVTTIQGTFTVGYQRAVAQIRARPGDARRRLGLALLSDAWDQRCRTLADHAEWNLPGQVLVVVVDAEQRPDLRKVDHVRVHAQADLVVIAAHDQGPALRQAVLASPTRFATTATVDASRIAAAARDARTLARLIRTGVVSTESRWLDCAQHLGSIMVATQPAQRDQFAAQVLAPLDGHPCAYRRSLLRTLAGWLAVGENANKIAAQTGLHAQTIRSHLHALRAFEAIVNDPDQAIMLRLILSEELTGAA